MSLITLDQAAAHLRITLPAGSPPDPLEADLQLKMAAAESIVLHYINCNYPEGSPATWDDLTVPELVRAAILLQLGELWRFRGDDAGGPQQATGDLSPAIANLLKIGGYHIPAVR